jgi:hypothetical protein
MLFDHRLQEIGHERDLLCELVCQAEHHGLALRPLFAHFEKVPDLDGNNRG